PLMAQTPEELTGIWESEDRIIFFGKDNEISIILKVFDRWYFDRAAQSEKFEEKSSRDRNSATSKNPVILSCNFEKIENTEECYEITLYDEKEKISRIPLCLLNDKIFLDFLIKIPESTRFLTFQDDKNGGDEIDENSIYGYWQGINAKNNIRISPQKEKQNIYSYFILPQAIYQLRFWQTDMEYSSEGKASFTDGENVFTVSKHIFTGGNNFSCTSGRSTRIRNVNKFQKLPFEAVFSEKNNVLAIGKGNFSRAGEASKERLLQIVKEANSRKKPLPPSPFPEESIDFHWDLIDALEKNNPQIQAIRERQKDFGIRGKDIGK
ncbi:MAG: hypothetical protein K6E78_11200, partial [Treponema sp.]|nr:hypothetical protein [Treponema sp.]